MRIMYQSAAVGRQEVEPPAALQGELAAGLAVEVANYPLLHLIAGSPDGYAAENTVPGEHEAVPAQSGPAKAENETLQRRRWKLAAAIRLDDIVPNPYQKVEQPEGSGDMIGQLKTWGRRYRLLAAYEEVELAKAIEAGVFATERLANMTGHTAEWEEYAAVAERGRLAHSYMMGANIGWLLRLAASYKRGEGAPLPLEELVRAGFNGLDNAVQRFDYKKGNKFSTFSKKPILRAMQLAVIHEARTIRLPQQIYILRRAALQTKPQDRTPQQLEVLEITDETDTISLSTPLNETGDLTLENTIDAFAVTPLAETAADVDDFIEQIGTLDEMEQRALKDYLYRHPRGITGILSEAGEKVGAYLVARALAKLSHPSNPALQPMLTAREPWRAEAKCRDGSLYPAFVSREGRKKLSMTVHKIQAICDSCPVTEHCGEFASAHKPRVGVWGKSDKTSHAAVDAQIQTI